MRIVLASGSPRRRELMKLITADFECAVSEADETFPKDTPVLKASEYLAELKAKAVAEKYPDDLVIGCDTTVIYEGRIFGKPKCFEECTEILKLLSGSTHQVVTGCSLILGGKTRTFSEITDVAFRKLTFEEMEEYALSEEPYDKAGGYGIQGKGALLVEKINGDYNNVVGLPVSRLNQEIKSFIK